MSALSPSCWGMSQAIIAAPLRREAAQTDPETPGDEQGLGSHLQPPQWVWAGPVTCREETLGN